MSKRVYSTAAHMHINLPVGHIPAAGPVPEVRVSFGCDAGFVKARAEVVASPTPSPSGFNLIDVDLGAGCWQGGDVAVRIEAAVETLRRLPKEGPMGYASCLPEPLRERGEVWALAVEKGGYDSPRVRLGPPTGQAIDEMVETLWWTMWVPARHRKLLMAHALMRGRPDWKRLGRVFGVHEATLRRWRSAALDAIADRLNQDGVPVS